MQPAGRFRSGGGREECRIAAGIGAVLAVANVLDTGAFMVEAHPHEHVFFNMLVGGLRGARFRYEMDYWGLSYRRGLEAIVKHDADPAITVFAADPSGVWNAGALPYPDRQRLVFVDSLDQAKSLPPARIACGRKSIATPM